MSTTTEKQTTTEQTTEQTNKPIVELVNEKFDTSTEKDLAGKPTSGTKQGTLYVIFYCLGVVFSYLYGAKKVDLENKGTQVNKLIGRFFPTTLTTKSNDTGYLAQTINIARMTRDTGKTKSYGRLCSDAWKLNPHKHLTYSNQVRPCIKSDDDRKEYSYYSAKVARAIGTMLDIKVPTQKTLQALCNCVLLRLSIDAKASQQELNKSLEKTSSELLEQNKNKETKTKQTTEQQNKNKETKTKQTKDDTKTEPQTKDDTKD